MEKVCRIPNCIEKLFAASHCNTAFIGGSLTVGVGASDVSRTSWRALFMRYLYGVYQRRYHCQPSEVMGGIGACESYVAAFTLARNVIPSKPSLAFVEFCVNDRGAPDKDLVLKGMEGIVRQLVCAGNHCNVILLGAGNCEFAIDHSLHRRIAEHYDLPFVDMQGYVADKLKERGQTWADVTIPFEAGDPHHLNDYGNELCFEAMRECFEAEVALYESGHRKDRDAPVPEPLVSNEFQYASLIDPSRKQAGVTLEGEWAKKTGDQIPWYFDNVLAGQPGATMTVPFTGTAVAVFGLMNHNGLKVEAELDGEAIAGPYLRLFIEFGKGLVLAHGLANGEHVLKLTVGEPSKRHNKLENPTAQIAQIGVAAPPV